MIIGIKRKTHQYPYLWPLLYSSPSGPRCHSSGVGLAPRQSKVCCESGKCAAWRESSCMLPATTILTCCCISYSVSNLKKRRKAIIETHWNWEFQWVHAHFFYISSPAYKWWGPPHTSIFTHTTRWSTKKTTSTRRHRSYLIPEYNLCQYNIAYLFYFIWKLCFKKKNQPPSNKV